MTTLPKHLLPAVFGLLVAQFFIVPLFRDSTPQVAGDAALHETAVSEPDLNLHAFDDLGLTARAAYVLDLRTGKGIYSYNADAQLPLASITKLMTALVALEHAELTGPVAVTAPSLAQDGEYGFFLGELWDPTDLAALTLLSSSNDGAYALAHALPEASSDVTEVLNSKAEELGLEQTYFLNETGLDINNETHAGAFGSARDVARLFAYVMERIPEVIEATRLDSAVFESLSGIPHMTTNTNKVVNRIPWLIGSKTGYTDIASGNLVVAFDAGLARPMVAVVMGSTQEGRFDDMERLVRATFEALDPAP